ncbi:MAG: hypothetical protein HOL51_22810 [Gemmatimonadetes bacterium]|nr:hypothetical protein [Gemmatimonadota bacterium]MBT5328953.1 hypothetical protein [Gemmatimonadota bacterium]MBT5452563.1 hypothetical protein [Gemmatimonadota bacterium]MBT5803886.1 hypothetical protein [Gemmatimonadota bacterium]MBT6623084.1 hypothetical protein [Gemmatimonadota bacterium]
MSASRNAGGSLSRMVERASAEFAEGDQCGQDEVLGDQRRWQYRSADRGGGEGVVSGCGTREYSRYQGLM